MNKDNRALNKTFGDIVNSDPALRSLFASFAKTEDDYMRKRAKENPVKERLTTRMEGHAGYSYFQTYNGRGSKVRFCYSTNRNAAGYYLVWREVVTAKTLKRDQWDSSTSKSSATKTAEDMFKRFKASTAAAKITECPTASN